MTEINMFEEVPVEYAALIDEDQLLDHLATPEGAMAIYKDGFKPEILPEDERNGRDLLAFVREYIDEYGEPPDVSIIAAEGFVDFNKPIAPVDYVLNRYRQRYMRRQVEKIAVRIARSKNDPVNAIRIGVDELTQLRQETMSQKGVVTSADLFQTLEDYRARQGASLTGLTFGFPELDDHFGGLKVGELTVLLARPKRYKSWMLLKSATDALSRVDGDLAFATMELSEDEMRNRFHCMVAGVSWGKFMGGMLRQEELLAMEEVAHDLHEHPYKLRFFRPKMGERTVSYLAAYAREHGCKGLYIDQLSWFDGARDEKAARHKIGAIMEELKDAAQEFPIYMAAQYNREAAGVEGIADLSKIGEADFIGQTADNLLGIYASKDMMQSTPRIIHLGVIDSRSYEGGTWEIKVELNECSNFKCLGSLDHG